MAKTVHCWQDRGEWAAEKFGWMSKKHIRLSQEAPSATCMRPDGHLGPHSWTKDAEIGVTFSDEEG